MKGTQTTFPPGASGVVENCKRLRWGVAGVCSVLVIMVFLAFGQTLHHEFVNYDDNTRVYENPVVARGLTLQGIASVFSLKHSFPDYWHPLTFLTHMLDCQLYGLNPGGHHLTNVLLHAVVAVLVFLTVRQMTGVFWRSAFVAALFAIHPLRVESVAWVSERKDMLSGVFFLLTICAYLRYGRARWSLGRYLAVVGLFALGLMSKPTLMPLPFLLLVLDYWPLGRFGESAQPACNEGPPILSSFPILLRVIVEKLPMLALSIGSCIEAAIGNAEAFTSNSVVPRSLQFENVLVSYAAYLWQTIWPARLAVLYPFPRHGVPVWQVLLAVGVLAVISAGVFISRKRDRYLLVGWLWYLGMLVPMIGFVQAGSQSRADRYTYAPMMGLYLMLTWAAADWSTGRRHRRAALLSGAVLVLCILMVTTYCQTSYWRNSVTLWTHTVGSTRNNFLAHNNLGNALYQRGQRGEAVAQYHEALRIDPDCAEARINLGNAMMEQGQTEEAIAQYREALRINPAHTETAHSNLGNALLRQGQTQEAIAQYREALRINPAFAEARYNLGHAMLSQGQTQEAIAHFREALQLNPTNADAQEDLGTALLQQGRTEEAIARYREALRLNPAQVEAHNNLGNVLFQQGREEEAIAQLEKALELQPANISIQNNLAWMLASAPQASTRNGARAVQLATQASQSTGGDSPVILRTLAAAYAAAGEFPNAVQTAQHALQLAQAQSNADLASKLRREIKLYEAGQPYREGQ